MKCQLCSNDATSNKYQQLCVECETMLSSRDDERDEFFKEYKKEHAACPTCGGTSGAITLAGYILNLDEKENYKDLNNFTCSSCGDTCSIHQKVPVT